jgi:hypothetical protein
MSTADQVLYLNRNATSPMYNKVLRALEETKQGRATATQWAAMIRALSQKGVKSLEIDESSILGWLENRGPDPITKVELLKKLSSLLFTVKEVRLAAPKYPSYRQPGGTYHEFLYIANSERDNVADEIEAVEYEMNLLVFEPERLIDEPELVVRLERQRAALIEQKSTAIDFDRHHYSDVINGRHGRNLLAHCRVTERPDEGLYFIEEIQSDWAQRGRRQNWAAGYPKGPLVTSTEAWAGMVLRRQLQLAAMNPAVKHVSWITESMRNGGWQNVDEEKAKEQRRKAHDDFVAEAVQAKLAELEALGTTPEALAAAKSAVRVEAEQAARAAGHSVPHDMLNDFYLRLVPKLVEKMSGGKVTLHETMIGGRTVTVPSLEVTDATRARLADKQPVYSRASLLSVPRDIGDERLVGALRNASTMLGSVKHVRLATHLYDVATGRKVAGRYINNMVQVSLSSRDIEEVMDHECFHFAQEQLLTSRENALVEVAFAPGTALNNQVRELLTRRGDFALAKQCIEPGEAAAQGFAFWRQGALDVSEPPVRGLFSDIISLVKDAVAWIRREVFEHSLQTPQEVFHALATGALAERAEIPFSAARPRAIAE